MSVFIRLISGISTQLLTTDEVLCLHRIMDLKNAYSMNCNPVYEDVHTKSAEVLTNRQLSKASQPCGRKRFCLGLCFAGLILFTTIIFAAAGLSIASFLGISNVQPQVTKNQDSFQEITLLIESLSNSIDQLRAEVSKNFTIVESSQIQLQTMMNTNESFLAQAGQIENTINTNLRSIMAHVSQIESNVTINHHRWLSRAAQIENTVNTNHQSILDQIENASNSNHNRWLSRAAQIENTVNTNHQSILDQVTQIKNTTNSYHQSWLSRAAQIENTVNTNHQSILDQVTLIENTTNSNHQSWLSRAAQIENSVILNYQILTNRTDHLGTTMALNFHSLQQQANRIENTTLANFDSIFNSQGASYIRWGQNTCPTGRTTVYTGRVGGTAYSLKGGASNQVCLPENPQYYAMFRRGVQGHSIMYGSEYEQPVNSHNAASNENVPCAVCSVTRRQQVLMIPAKATCPSDWTREYNGYLMSELTTTYRSTFICVDYEQIPIPNTRMHNLATDLWHVEADCSSLPCGPYSSERELTCVVCTK